MIKFRSFSALMLLSFYTFMFANFSVTPAHAQSEAEQMNAMFKIIELKDPDIELNQISSLFLTSIEENLVISARKGFVTRAPTEGEFAREQRDAELEKNVVKSSPREVSLGGVLYIAPNEWTVWINSEKMTPKNLPSEILDIRVDKDSVKLKWFDIQTNQVFPIKLRTHQRFNLDTRIFLPG